jgi:hypothetical protein
MRLSLYAKHNVLPRVRRAAEVLALARHFFPLTRYTFTQGAESIQKNFNLCTDLEHASAGGPLVKRHNTLRTAEHFCRSQGTPSHRALKAFRKTKILW